MRRIESAIDTNSEEFRNNRAHHLELVKSLRERQQAVRYSRPERDLERLRRQNKLFVRDRLELLLDPGTPFLELSTLAANLSYGGDVPSAAVITGVGVVSGREVLVHADDSSVKGGAMYPLSVKKMIRAQEIAIENRLPIIHLCDSAGAFLPLQAELFADKYYGGRTFRNQCVLSKMGVPQVAVMLGHGTAGGAYVPALSDYAIIVRGTGAIFLGGPPLVKAATGEIVTAEELGGADLHTRVSGTADYPADSEEEGIALAREIVERFPPPKKAWGPRDTPEEPDYDPEELYGILPHDIRIQFDMREVIARIVDGSRFHEYQPDYGTTLVCGFANVWGYQVGILANNGVLFNDSSLKGAHFITLCNQIETPLLFIQNITGYMVGKEYEARGITKDGAKMIMAVVGSVVPKFTVMAGGSFGAGNYGMAGRAYDSRFLWSWPNAQTSVMGGEVAAGVLTELKVRQLAREGKEPSEEEIAAIREPVVAEYRRTSSAYYATSEIWDDGILDPVDTRNALGIGLSCAANTPIGEPGYGIFRF